ncbi:MAG: DNA topoisomerase (ATP-hydrolyzing) subunit B [Nanoarchaeota archaeon]
MGEKYTGENIKVLEGLEGVRIRPSMYIGSTSKYGLHKLVDEIVDNAVDEAMAGFCTNIDVTLNADGSVTVEDNGRGIPVDPHPVYKIPTVEVVITKLHAGGKFDKGSYKISGGLHGVGMSVVAALSKSFKVVVKRDGKIYQQEYEIGKPIYKLKVVGECDKKQTGTTITFTPDDTIFSVTKFDFSVLETRFREIAFLNKGVKISLSDKVTNKKEVFSYEGGLIDFVKWVNRTRNFIHAKPVYFMKEQEGVFVECAMQYNDGYQENVLSFVNTINTIEGGTHVVGFKTALTRAINDYGNKSKLLKDGNVTGDDVREGLTAIISVKVPEPQFEGQTKTKLGNSEVKGIVDSVSMIAMTEFFEENPQVARRIVDKAIEGQKARAAAKKAKELVRRKNAFSVGGLPGKLADCSSNKTEETELYLVEGDSAGGCFSGETEVALTDGRNLSFKELVEEDKTSKQNFCYTIKSDGSVGISKIESPRLTKKDAEVIKIILDNDQEIICTPNHKFMLRDGTYIKSKDLTINDSLMPLYRELLPKFFFEDTRINARNVVSAPLAVNHKVKLIKKLNQKIDAPPHLKRCGLIGARFLDARSVPHTKVCGFQTLRHEKIDVYDIEVSGTHNFALASGVFVHNSAKTARNKEFQAILPLKGKILNVEKAQPVKVLSNEEIANMITAIGAGITDQFDISKLRYSKIILMADADVDGAHIRTLLLTFFFRFMPKLIENGNIYIAVSPLYRVRKRGDHYVYSDKELKELLSKLGGNVDVQRFKGLGEMNAEQLWETTMNPKTRMLKKVTIEDSVKADEVFSKLMGDDVEPRKQFISEHASEAQIDI